MERKAERQQIEESIERARNGVSERIDELDRRIRATMDVRAFASEHAEQLVAGGAVVGFLFGFGFPKVLRRVVQIGLPAAMIACRVMRSRDRAANRATPRSPG